MERNLKTRLLFLLVALFHVWTVRMEDCIRPSDNSLSCYSDYNRIMTCVWNSPYASEPSDSGCTVDANKSTKWKNKFTHQFCKLEASDESNPALRQCSMDIGKDDAFQSIENWIIELKCNSMQQRLKINFRPYFNIKLNPSGKPDVNFTSVSWSAQSRRSHSIKHYTSELQWKRQDQSWTDPSVLNRIKDCDMSCQTELDEELFFHGETYEARTRVQPQDCGKSTWSDWSPTTTWVSTVGKTRPPPDASGGVFCMIFAATVALTLALSIAFYKFDKTNWIYVIKKIRGPPIPNPASSFLKDVNLQSWLSPPFTSRSFHSLLKPVEITSVEVTSTVDAVAPCKLEAALLEKVKSESSSGSRNSTFSNPSYSHLCSAPPVSSLTGGNLQPCAADSPYGPVVQCQSAEQSEEEQRAREMEIFELLSKGGDGDEAVQVVSDYEKVEKPQVERVRLQSLDSGVCSAEEASEESLEADSINMSDGQDEEAEETEETLKEFHRLFGGTGGILGKGSIQVCSDYERVQKPLAGSPELPSLDSGVGSGGEEQASQEESVEGVDKPSESTRFLFPPPSCSPLGPLPPSSPPGWIPAVLPLPSHLLGRIAFTSTSRSVEPSCDGYMPVKQDDS